MTPPSNTGVNNGRRLGADERLVLEGGQVKVLCAERQQDKPSGVIVDYLRVTVRKDSLLQLFQVADAEDDELCQSFAFKVASVLGFTLGESRKGRDYYDHTWTIVNSFEKEIGSVSGGGVSQRNTFCLTLKGEGCTYAAAGWEAALHSMLDPLDPRITRIDLARDFLAGEVCMEEVVGHYTDGSFDYRNRRPSYQQHGCWLDGRPGSDLRHLAGGMPSIKQGDGFPALFGHARTFQVGQRDSGKLLRAYEKGHQFKMLDDPWVRIEVELRNVNRIIPFDALIRPADFFAGAYDFCQMCLDEKPVPERVQTGKAVGELTVKRFTSWFERVVAPSIRIVQAALPDGEWADLLTVKHINRKTPRGLAGISHAQVFGELREWVSGLSTSVPAGGALSM